MGNILYPALSSLWKKMVEEKRPTLDIRKIRTDVRGDQLPAYLKLSKKKSYRINPWVAANVAATVNITDRNKSAEDKAKLFRLLFGTAMTESQGGLTLGKGSNNYMQVTRTAYNDVRDVKSHAHLLNRLKTIRNRSGIDLRKQSLDNVKGNPLLNMLDARMLYKNKPEAIPATRKERAKYYKKYYNSNSVKAKGKASFYLKRTKGLEDLTSRITQLKDKYV